MKEKVWHLKTKECPRCGSRIVMDTYKRELMHIPDQPKLNGLVMPVYACRECHALFFYTGEDN